MSLLDSAMSLLGGNQGGGNFLEAATSLIKDHPS